MSVSIRAYAKCRGVSHVAVLKAIKAGRIPAEADGTVDPVKANATWERSTDPGRRKKANPSFETLRPVAEAAVGSVRATLKEQGLASGGSFGKGSGVTFVHPPCTRADARGAADRRARQTVLAPAHRSADH